MAIKDTHRGVFVYSKRRWVSPLMGLGFAAAAVYAPWLLASTNGLSPGPVSLTLAVLIALVILAFFTRVAFCGVLIGGDVLVIRGMFKVTEIPRGHVTGFGLIRSNAQPYVTVSVLLVGGEERKLDGLGVSSLYPQSVIEGLLDDCYDAMKRTDPSGAGLNRVDAPRSGPWLPR